MAKERHDEIMEDEGKKLTPFFLSTILLSCLRGRKNDDCTVSTFYGHFCKNIFR
jgi:hypothetical protein